MKIKCIALLSLALLLTGCSNEFEEVAEAIEESSSQEQTVVAVLAEKVETPKELSSEHYPMDRAIINFFESKNLEVTVVEWRYIGEDTIYILDDKARKFIVDKSNVTFISTPLS